MSGATKSATNRRALSAVILAIALFGASLGAIAAPPDAAGEGLFSEVAPADGSSVGDDPTIVRSRLVSVDLSRLGAPAALGGDGVSATLVLNFFADAVYPATLDRVEVNASGSFSWIGHLEGVALSQVILVVKDGVMVGNVVGPGVFYQVRHIGDGVHAIRQADQTAFPPEAPPIPVDLPAGDLVQPTGAADDGSTIDVLVVYTDDARVAAGGTSAIQGLIDVAVAETNAGYTNSGIDQQINLVHRAEVSYDESGFDWSQTLSRLRTHNDSYLDTVTAPGTGLRDTYCADEVVLVVKGDSQYCGMAYLMTTVSHDFEDWAFAVVAYNCATGYYSFGHEMGHNMGAHHDRANASGQGAYSYSYGYQAPDEAFRTVMAYNCPGGCPRVNHWSNPDVSYGGQPTGVPYTEPDSADNRRTLNNTAYTVANFRVSNHPPNVPGSPTPADGAVGQIGSVDLSWTGGDPDAGDTVTYDVYLEAGDSTPDTLKCDDVPTPTCDPGPLSRGAHYYWRVIATDNHGASTSGPVWDFYVNQLPHAPSDPMPPDGAAGESRDTELSWTGGGDPDAGDTVTYTVYLDTDPSPGSQVCQDTAATCDPGGTLLANTHYYWRVVATDDHSESTSGPVWDFTTGTSTGPTIRGYVRDASLTAIEGVTVTFSGLLTTTTTGSDGYYAQAGFGGGTVTVTVAVEAGGYTFSPWLDQVALSGDVAHHVTGYPLTPTGLLFYDGFEGSGLDSAWAVETDFEGRVQISITYPHQGSNSLLLDDDTGNATYSHASAILSLDLSGEEEVKLSFWWREFYDENGPEDGVFISDDNGVSWYKVYSFTASSTFTRTFIDLDEQADDAGMSFNEHFLVKFQFYDNFYIDLDGYAIDDVVVYSDNYNVYLPLAMKAWP
jgi:hypothetical protein